ncbi:QacE family quaternary ammonium compound efflux SMR transporter [Nocardioides glacieisoli]|uniref:QacE family quaternary ammonium compound efflux SMR transporter n=1 Tax=Nocardioides glacieisoli TaxID=1168730 RepID=A0A4Q2RTX3_9ACTN|nr:SMR family transporter [Nocardioides glacieisoli]RYB92268.1 QacE family quaternary ammonium compound efflux SMR transporter [Nocardioides glacieisoli]
MYPLLLLLVAIVAEVAATVMLKSADGFSRLVPSILVFVGYATSYIALGFALKLGLNLGTGYAMWAGLGALAAAVAGTVLFDEHLTHTAIFGIVLVLAGVLLINLTGPTG